MHTHEVLDALARRQDLRAEVIADVIASGDRRLLHPLARNPTLPVDTLLFLARHEDAAVRGGVLRDGAPRSVFELLVADPDVALRVRFAQCVAPADLLARLAADPVPHVRAVLARWWPRAPEPVRRRLLTDPVDDVRAAACSTYYARLPHPVPPADLVPALLADPVTRPGAVRHTSLTAATAARLAGDEDEEVRREVAAHPNLPVDLLPVLGGDQDGFVRVRIFARAETPAQLRAAIHSGLAAAGFPTDLAGEEGERAFVDSLAAHELADLRLDWVTADPLSHVDSPYACFRASAAAGDLPPAAVTRLLSDESSAVRVAAFRRAPDLVAPATVERIERTYVPARHTTWRPADDVAFPLETLRRFATDEDPRMRSLAPRDPTLPAAVATRLAADPSPLVRQAVAANPNLPTEALVALLSDEDTDVACAAASAPHLPAAEVARLLSGAASTR